LQKNVIKAMDIYIGECVEPKVIENPYELLSHIISFPIANIVVGEECYYNEDILEAFRDLTSAVFKLFIVPPILSFIHPWLHQQFVTMPLRFGWNPASKHFDVIIKRIRPVVEKRLNDKKRLGDAWVAPLDALQYYLNDPDITPDLDPNHVDYVHIANAIGSFIIAAMGTTTSSGARALYDLATRKEYWQELYQEAQEINKQCNGNELTIDDIAKMVKLYSFVKESLRFTSRVVALPHKCVTKSHYTFENGYQIRNGTVVMVNMLDTAYDEELQGQNPTEFKAYRHLDRNSPATKLERNFIIFGGGKHACPGRSLAVNEVKVFLHKVMLKYNVSIENEKVMKKYLGPIPRMFKASFVFENRKDVV
ncbi:4381_t:CDS:2, partial [Scutellospora calospora]